MTSSALVRGAAVSLMMVIAGFVMFGGFGDARGPVFALPLAAVLALGAVAFRRGRTVRDLAWVDGPGHAAFVAPSTPPAPRVESARRAVVSALARAEARQWRESGWFLVGVGFCALQLVLFAWVWAEDPGTWVRFLIVYPVMAHPLTGMVVVGAHFAVTRSRRDGSEEIFAACPADESTRTAAHLVAGWVPAATLALFVVLMTVVVAFSEPSLYGARWLLVGDALAAIVLGWCGVALGVALARWVRFSLAPIVAVFVLLFVIVGVGNLGEPHWSNLRQLSTWPRYPDHDLLFTDRHVWSHAAWLVALGALMAVIAFVHARRDRRTAVAAVTVIACVCVTGVIPARPISDAGAKRIAALVADPVANQTCRTAPGVSVCVYRGYEEYADRVAAHVRPVAAAAESVSRGTAAAVVLRQHFDGRLAHLGPGVREALAGRGIGRPDTALGYETARPSMHRARFVVASSAVGLPVSPPAGRYYVAAGQARGVVAVWLAAQGLEPKRQTEIASYHVDEFALPDDYVPSTFDVGNAWPQTCDGAPPAVVWSAPDLLAARRLLAAPSDQISAALATHWERILDPTTTTNDLLTVLGLESVPTAPHLESRKFDCGP